MLDNASFDTSSHQTIDFLIKSRPAKSWYYGQGGRYEHIKKQRPVKRSLSAHNFNWNLLVQRLDMRFEREEKENAARISGKALTKLKQTLGEELLLKLQTEHPELYEKLMEHIKAEKHLTFSFCKDLLATHNLNLEEELALVRK